MKWMRCIFKNADQSETIQIDVIMDEQEVVQRGPTYFGLWTDSDGPYPFSLSPSGLADFGIATLDPEKSKAEQDSERYGSIDICGKCLLRDASVTWVYKGYEYFLKLDEKRDLIERELQAQVFKQAS